MSTVYRFTMHIHLAPMEGVVNARMRALLTAVGGIDRCITEFVRVTDQLLPARVFYRLCPELHHGGTTPSGTPVYVQLLGSEPGVMADNAARAAELGAPGIDLNFGCPAKCVNRHRGGSILLDEPELIYAIVSSIRRQLPDDVPLTVKIRLGFRDSLRFHDVVNAAETGGASLLTIHARTREDGYTPPAHWHQIAPARERFGIAMVANGEIWTPEHADLCQRDSGCEDIMLGRGLLSRPDLALHIKQQRLGNSHQPWSWEAVFPLLHALFEDSLQTCAPRHVGGPSKQWLGYLRRTYPQAQELFEQIKRLREPADLQEALQQHLPKAA
ncbi:tRNA-dihydrouridine synthase [Spongiibacter tropicus]|uniref:tRNA-dihydrouridine synthase n=1 Tax=Spongiibacter tropicus TaxID=454602 RepID=UPI00048D26E7